LATRQLVGGFLGYSTNKNGQPQFMSIEYAIIYQFKYLTVKNWKNTELADLTLILVIATYPKDMNLRFMKIIR